MKNIRTPLVAAALFAALSVGACSPGAANPSLTPPTGAVVITGNQNQFAPASLTASAGQPFQIWFSNLENVPHNVHVKDAAGATVAGPGEIFNGPAARTLDVPALNAAAYRVFCDVHPEMTAELVAN